jgi:hypothetical protein
MGSYGLTSATNLRSTADSVPKEETTASRPGMALAASSTISWGLARASRSAKNDLELTLQTSKYIPALEPIDLHVQPPSLD